MTAKIDSRIHNGMTSYAIEGSREEVEAAIRAIEQNYHPLGYGTSFGPLKQRKDGTFTAHGSRSNSCD